MYRSINRRLAAACFALLAVPLTAGARNMPAFGGQAQNPAQSTCFTNSLGTVKNICAAVRQYCAALPIDTTGSKTVVINVLASGILPVRCHAQGINQDGTAAGSSASGSALSGPITLAVPAVPVGGALYACCDLPQTARINTFRWNQ